MNKLNKPKVTIITPTYNDDQSIIETMTCIQEQSYKNIEHIIVDDGSTDNTKLVIEEYIKSLDKTKDAIPVKYIYQTNKDQLNAIITGLEYATRRIFFYTTFR